MRRKIETKKDIEKKKKRNNLLIGGVMIVILFGSIFGTFLTMFGNNSEKGKALSYRGIPLEKQGNLFVLTMGDKSFYFLNNPNEIVSANYDVNISKTTPSYMGAPLYIDSFDYVTAQEIAQNFQGYPERITNACIDEDDCADNTLPIKTCSDNMIIIRESVSNKVYQEENCIYIEGTNEDLIKVADAFLLKSLGLN